MAKTKKTTNNPTTDNPPLALSPLPPALSILTFTPVWRRPEIFRICLQGINRLVNYAPERYKITPFFIISESWAAVELQKYGWDWVAVQNHPLGNKKNMGLKYAMQQIQEFDYILEIGSDDLIKNEYLDLAEPLLREGKPHISASAVHFIDTTTGKTAAYITEKIIGLGRFIKAEALKPIPRLELWNPEGDRGMDTFSWRHLEQYGIKKTTIETNNGELLDIKSATNINAITPYTPTPHITAADLCAHYPEGPEIMKLIK